MYIPTDVDLAELAQVVELVDKLYNKIGKAENYDLIEDFGIHYQLGKISEMLRFGTLRILRTKKGAYIICSNLTQNTLKNSYVQKRFVNL